MVLTTADTTMAELRELLPHHLDHQIALEKAGVLLAAGPWVNDSGRVTGGLIILRAQSAEATAELMELDPFVSSGTFTYEVRRWKLNEGRINVSIDFSDRTSRFD